MEVQEERSDDYGWQGRVGDVKGRCRRVVSSRGRQGKVLESSWQYGKQWKGSGWNGEGLGGQWAVWEGRGSSQRFQSVVGGCRSCIRVIGCRRRQGQVPEVGVWQGKIWEGSCCYGKVGKNRERCAWEGSFMTLLFQQKNSYANIREKFPLFDISE